MGLEPVDPLTTMGCTGTCELPELIPVLTGILGTRYLYMGDLSVQVFPQINLQVPVHVPRLVQCPSRDKCEETRQGGKGQRQRQT